MIAKVKRLIGQRSPIRIGYHHLRAFLAAARYSFPAKKLTVIGITGTDGKTTTVGMAAHILQSAGYKTGALSTAFFQIGDQIEWNETQKTSPSPFVIQRFLSRLTKAGCTHAVLEYSSHGLVQGRTKYTWPKVAAITNLSEEHLDYHGSMEQYQKDKAKLFSMAHRGTKVLNAADRTYASYQSIPTAHTISYAADAGTSADLTMSDVRVQADSSQATLHKTGESQGWPLHLQVAGVFQFENALCAIACASALGVDPGTAAQSLSTFRGAPGRMERIEAGQDFAVFVDFTVTPGAYQKTLAAARAMLKPGKKLLVLTGSCGDRMKEKRPKIGRICSELADVVVVSNEDPYTEDPLQIIEEVWSGIDTTKAQAQKIPDRRAAMAYLFSQAQTGDIVLLCGKGSDTTMWTAEGQIPWNERSIATEMLQKKAAQ